MYENDIVIKLFMPYVVDDRDIKITKSGNRITVQYMYVKNDIVLPQKVMIDKVMAQYEKNYLRISVSKE